MWPEWKTIILLRPSYSANWSVAGKVVWSVTKKIENFLKKDLRLLLNTQSMAMFVDKKIWWHKVYQKSFISKVNRWTRVKKKFYHKSGH